MSKQFYYLEINSITKLLQTKKGKNSDLSKIIKFINHVFRIIRVTIIPKFCFITLHYYHVVLLY